MIMKTRNRYVAMPILLYILATVAAGQCQQQNPKQQFFVDLAAAGAISEGLQWNDLSLDTYFQDVSKLYFVLHLGCKSTAPIPIGAWERNVSISIWKRLVLKKAEWPYDGPRPEPVGDNIPGEIKMLAAVRNLQRQGGGGFYDTVDSGVPSSGTIKLGAGFYNLIEVVPAAPLPPGDYLLVVQIGIDGKKYEGGACFRCRKFQATDPNDLAKLRKQEAWAAALQGNLERERRLLEHAVEEAPDSPWSWYYLGEYYRDNGNYEKALKVWSEAQSRFPSPAGLLAELKRSPYAGHVKEPDTGNWVKKTICFEPLVEFMKKYLPDRTEK